jgi:hypothetical protein
MPIFITGLMALERKIARVSMVSDQARPAIAPVWTAAMRGLDSSMQICAFHPGFRSNGTGPQTDTDALHRTSLTVQFRLIAGDERC